MLLIVLLYAHVEMAIFGKCQDMLSLVSLRLCMILACFGGLCHA
jgi:hypothetical protein